MFCNQCGQSIDSTDAFCRHCGAARSLAGSDPAAAGPEPETRQVRPIPGPITSPASPALPPTRLPAAATSPV